MPEERKRGWMILIILVAVGGFFGWPYLQWFRFELEARDTFRKDLGRFPEPHTISTDFPNQLRTVANKFGFDEVDVKMELERRTLGLIPTHMVRTTITSGSHTFVHNKRSERAYSEAEIEQLRADGVSYTDLVKE